MKKSIIYLCLITLISALTLSSCYFGNKSSDNETTKVEQVADCTYEIKSINDIAEHNLLDYDIEKTEKSNVITFGEELYSYEIYDILYSTDIRITEYERDEVFCNSTIYEQLKIPESIYSKDNNFVRYCKKTHNGKLYYKIIICKPYIENCPGDIHQNTKT